MSTPTPITPSGATLRGLLKIASEMSGSAVGRRPPPRHGTIDAKAVDQVGQDQLWSRFDMPDMPNMIQLLDYGKGFIRKLLLDRRRPRADADVSSDKPR